MNVHAGPLPLQGKVALVTGAARGLGATIAESLAQAGAAVLLTDRSLEGVEQVAAGIRARGGMAGPRRHDVTVERDWEAAVLQALEQFGGLDIVVNNAGIEIVATFAECTLEEFRAMQDVNVTGVFLGIKHAIRAMRPCGPVGRGGTIINLSSVAGLVGVVGMGGYCASKGAVRLMSKAAGVECARLGYDIRVNSLHPAIVKTEMGVNVVKGLARIGLAPNEAAADTLMESLHPLGYGRPADISSAVLYLASDASRWMTGAELVIDGGATAC